MDESALRQLAHGTARAGLFNQGDSIIEDAITSGLAPAVARRVVAEAFAAEREAAERRLQARQRRLDRQDVTADGLSVGIERAGFRLSWNSEAERVELQRPDSGAWEPATGPPLDAMMEAVSQSIMTHDGRPWRCGHRLEGRLLVVVAHRHVRRGDQSAITEAVAGTLGEIAEQCESRPDGWTMTQIAERAKVLKRYDSLVTAPRSTQRDVRRALEAAGWRQSGNTRRWFPPVGYLRDTCRGGGIPRLSY